MSDSRPITDSELNEVDAIFADFEWIDFKRPVWRAVTTRLHQSEAERDALTARVAQLEACLTDVKEQLEIGERE